MAHVLLTNDFPPKTGGIQSYLWELWRRLDPSSFAVLTASSHRESLEFDSDQRNRGIRIERTGSRLLLPTVSLRRRVRRLTADTRASLVVVDPALPVGLIGPHVGLPYAVVLHGAEVTVPARVPLSRPLLASVLARSSLLICAGGYPADEARRVTSSRLPTLVEIPPGVDLERFRPLGRIERSKARASFDLPGDGLVIVSVGRLVPRKGMDVLIEAAAALRASFPNLVVAIGGEGRDLPRLERLVRRSSAPVRLLGHVPEASLPALYASGDAFVMACRDRWGGLEREGFGIVYLEAAASGVPQVAGRSGGAHEAVAHGETGFVVDEPSDPGKLAAAIRRLVSNPDLRGRMGEESRRRAEAHFGYEALSRRLAEALENAGS